MNARSISLLIFCLFICNLLSGQIQEIELNPDGVVVPRLNRTTVVSPEAGQLVFDINTNSFWFHDGSDWVETKGVFERSGDLIRPAGSYDVDDFIFGRAFLPENGLMISDTFMFFDKDKAVLRGGRLSNSADWSPDSLGKSSFAFGHDVKARGESAIAFGENSVSTGVASFATGSGSNASGNSATAIGSGTVASGDYSVAMGRSSQATGSDATALGLSTKATGSQGATALGQQTVASGHSGATALGYQTEASGFNGPTAMGYATKATGEDGSTAIGFHTIATGNKCTVVGEWNDTIVATGTTVGPTSPLFIVGNGSFGLGNQSNAMVVQKNGNVGIGANSPDALIHIKGEGTGLHVEDGLPVVLGADTIGAGIKAFWLPSKAAFRAGAVGTAFFVGSDEKSWDFDSIGRFSFATGHGTLAKGDWSIAMGAGTKAKRRYSIAMGLGTSAEGEHSIALGSRTVAEGRFSTVIGLNNELTGDNPIFIDPTTRLFVVGNGDTPTERSNAMVIQKNGRVGIGTSSPQGKLDIFQPSGDIRMSMRTNNSWSIHFEQTESSVFSIYNGGVKRFTIRSNGRIGIGTDNPSTQLHTTGGVRFANFGAGTVTTDANGNLSVSSDIRLKNVNGSFDRGLEAISQLSPIRYNWKSTSNLDTTNTYTGFSAQNVQEAIPEAVGANADGYLTLSDRPIIATLVNAVNQQQKMIEQQQLIIEAQSQSISELKELVDSMLPSESKDLGQKMSK